MPLAESSPAESHEDIYSRIRTIGQAGKVLCSFVLVVLLGVAFSSVIFGALCVFMADVVSFSAGPVSLPESTSPWGKTAVFAADTMILAVPALFVAFAFWQMRKLFGNFEQGNVLTSANGRLIRWIGIWCFVAAAVAIEPVSVIFGLFLFVLGWAMELAASVKKDQDLTV